MKRARPALTSAAQAICATLHAEARIAGWTRTAQLSGVSRETLHRSLKRNMHLSTAAAVADALGFDIVIQKRGGV